VRNKPGSHGCRQREEAVPTARPHRPPQSHKRIDRIDTAMPKDRAA
jgi:hypothetical protein